MFSLKKKPRLRFIPAEFAESPEELSGPSRGWFCFFPFTIGRTFDPEELKCSLRKEQTLVFVQLNIGPASGRSITEEEQNEIGRLLKFFADNGKDMILRIVYDTVGKGMEAEPHTLARIAGHIKTLGSVLQPFMSRIFVLQGALVGSWGEMHSSKYLSEEKLHEIFSLLSEFQGESAFLAVRTPGLWRMLHNREEWEEKVIADAGAPSGYRMGLYDDAILASVSDLGTFGYYPSESSLWADRWAPEDELLFENRLMRYFPQGGEVLSSPDGKIPLEAAAERLRKMRITYLNCQYDRSVLDFWAEETWHSDDCWNGTDGLSYIGRHLGYRLLVKQSSAAFMRQKDRLKLSAVLENTGFAPFYQKTRAFFVLISRQGVREEFAISFGDISCRDEIILEEEISAVQGEVYLRIERESDGRPLPFANKKSQISSDIEEIYLGKITTEERNSV